MAKAKHYEVPPSYWPILGTIAIFLVVLGFIDFLNNGYGMMAALIMFMGFSTLAVTLFGWFGEVIYEQKTYLKNDAKNDSMYRWSMGWFIFSEVMFFATFFGALFYIRVFVLTFLSGEPIFGMIDGQMDHLWTHFQWSTFTFEWPLLKNPSAAIMGATKTIDAFSIPLYNTLILLTSGVTITIAHFALVKGQNFKAIIFQALTIILAIWFLMYQYHEYGHAYHDHLTLSSGIYGNLFYLLTGFHGMHVMLGTLMLVVIMFRMIRGDFSQKHHFAFEAVSWYWHFVDVVWLILFVFVYWI
ncbi:MAG: cytochrome c oxidase subunit 3 [Candidatus Comchoanobacterales bacterium]